MTKIKLLFSCLIFLISNAAASKIKDSIFPLMDPLKVGNYFPSDHFPVIVDAIIND